MRKFVQILMSFMLLVSMLFTFQGCEKDDVLKIEQVENKYKREFLTFDEIKRQRLN